MSYERKQTSYCVFIMTVPDAFKNYRCINVFINSLVKIFANNKQLLLGETKFRSIQCSNALHPAADLLLTHLLFNKILSSLTALITIVLSYSGTQYNNEK
jgi:hypothetical protein